MWHTPLAHRDPGAHLCVYSRGQVSGLSHSGGGGVQVYVHTGYVFPVLRRLG